MDSLCCYAGSASYGGTPNWEPLLAVTPDEIDDFMWMFEVELEDSQELLTIVLRRRPD